jgi:hypothetical protein
MRRSTLTLLALTAGGAVAACEDGPKQTYVAPPANAGSYWNNGRGFPTDGGFPAIVPGAATNATAPYAVNGVLAGNTGGNNANEICTGTQQHSRWAAMFTEAIRPPNAAAGIDLAGFTGSGVNISPLENFWQPGDMETWQGVTIEEAEHINCQGTDLGTYFGGTDEFAVSWGDNEEVVFDSYVSNHKGFYLVLNFGYLGEMDFQTADGMTKYKMRVDGTPTQISTNGGQYQTVGGSGGLDWTNAANGDPTAMADFDLMFRALMATYTGLPPEPDGVTCNQTGACELIIFPGGNIYPGGPNLPGAVFFVPAINWAWWVQPFSTAISAATAVRMDFNLQQLMNYSNLNAVEKLDSEGPISASASIGKGPSPCALQLGMTYGNFLNDCVQTDQTSGANAEELLKLTAGLTHDQETFQFNVPGIDLSFSSGGTLGPTQVVTDSALPNAADPATEFNVDQSTLGLLSNDWTFDSNGVPLAQNLQGMGALYAQFRNLAIEHIYQEAGLTLPAGGVDALIASCIAPRDPATGDLLPNTPNGFDPGTWIATMQQNGCTGLETLLTPLQTYESDGVTPNNDDPVNLGMLDTPFISGSTVPAPIVTFLDPGYSLGMKMGTQVAMFCLDAESANNMVNQAIAGTYGQEWPQTSTNCDQGPILAQAFAEVVKVMGHGAASNLPLEIRDTRFFFKMYGYALIQTLEATNSDGSLSSVPGLGATAWGDGTPGSSVPISFNDLYFDSIGSGQFEDFEYVDRRFVCPDGAQDCCPSAAAMAAGTCCPNSEPNCNPNEVVQPPLDLQFSADVKDGIMSAYDTWRYNYRGEDGLYTVMQNAGYAEARESNALLTNMFGNPLVPTVFSSYQCATTFGAYGAAGMCAAPQTTACTMDSDCNNSLLSCQSSGFCGCNADAACAPGETCSAGFCQSPVFGGCQSNADCPGSETCQDPSPVIAACNGVVADTYTGGPMVDIDGLPIDFTEYQGIWNPTAFSLSYNNASGVYSQLSIVGYYPGTPTEHPLATQALVEMPLYSTTRAGDVMVRTSYQDPANPPTQTGSIQRLINFTPDQPGNGFAYAVYGQAVLDNWVQSASIDFTGISISALLDYKIVPDPTPHNPNAVAINALSVESPDFLGNAFLCFIPGATFLGQPMPLLAARMYSPVNKIMDWITENPQAYDNQTGCGIVVRWSSYDNYIDLIDATSTGVRLDVTQGGGFGRVVGVQLYVPGTAAEQ